MPLPLPQAITRLLQNEEAFDLFVNGAESQSYVTRDGTVVPTLRRFLRDLKAQVVGIADQPTDALFADLFVILSQKVSLGNKTVNDTNYIALPSDVQIVYTALSQSRSVELPNITDYPYGQDFVVADGSNSATDTNYIEIKVKTGTNQSIKGESSILLSNRGQSLRFRRASDTLWFLN